MTEQYMYMWKRTNKLLLENNRRDNRTSRNPSESWCAVGERTFACHGRDISKREIRKYSMLSTKWQVIKSRLKQDARARRMQFKLTAAAQRVSRFWRCIHIYLSCRRSVCYISACSVENLCAKTTFVEICILTYRWYRDNPKWSMIVTYDHRSATWSTIVSEEELIIHIE